MNLREEIAKKLHELNCMSILMAMGEKHIDWFRVFGNMAWGVGVGYWLWRQ